MSKLPDREELEIHQIMPEELDRDKEVQVQPLDRAESTNAERNDYYNQFVDSLNNNSIFNFSINNY